jgi:hypothetical protein
MIAAGAKKKKNYPVPTPEMQRLVDKFELSDRDMEQLYKRFTQLDTDQSGEIDIDEFAALFGRKRDMCVWRGGRWLLRCFVEILQSFARSVRSVRALLLSSVHSFIHAVLGSFINSVVHASGAAIHAFMC